MLTGIHILMTYTCTLECDHCFLYSSPRSKGTMTISQIRNVLDESLNMGGVEWIYFEGGEPFLFYPSLIEAVRIARDMGFKVGIVTNAYGAVSGDDAEIWLRPLADLGVGFLSISDDAFHYGEGDSPAKRGLEAARKLGIPTDAICIRKPYAEEAPGKGQDKGSPVIGGGAMFKGRAVETLTRGLPLRPASEMVRCPHEDLEAPSRVHVDPYGHVHLCQGISMGNMWRQPLSGLARNYDPRSHPICGPLIRGGPYELARHYDVPIDEGYVDECHLCYCARSKLIDRFPELLAPGQVYGIVE